jgi:hypothetical protein
VVLDEEIGGVGREGLRGLRVRETWVGGKRVYRREEEEEEEAEAGEVKEDL